MVKYIETPVVARVAVTVASLPHNSASATQFVGDRGPRPSCYGRNRTPRPSVWKLTLLVGG